MMKVNFFYIILNISILFAFVAPLAAQSPLTGERLRSEGEMPTAMKKALADKKERFFQKFAEQGQIVYGSELNTYLETILNHLLINEPELREKITLLVVKSPVVQAVAYHEQKTIFVYTGLLAQVSNEAELAFILSHEVAHIALEHEVAWRKWNYNKHDLIDMPFFVRERETEADNIGFTRFFKNSKYALPAAVSVFNVLQYGHLPFDNIPFDRDFLQSDAYSFPAKYFPVNTNPIDNRDDYLDTLCTHPNIAKRRENIRQQCSETDHDIRQSFVQDSALFVKMQHLCRVECLNYYLVNHHFAEAFYNAYLLYRLQMYPEDSLAWKNVMSISLYGLNLHKENGSLNDILPEVSSVEGEMHPFVHLIKSMSRQELNVLAVRELWKRHQESPEQHEIREMLEDAAKMLIGYHHLTWDKFCDYPLGTLIDSIDMPKNDPTQSLPLEKPKQGNKYERIEKTNNTLLKVKPSSKFKLVNYMLADLKQDTGFVAFFIKMQRTIPDEYTLQAVEQVNSKTLSKKVPKKNRINLPTLGEEPVLFFPPRYIYKKYNAKRSVWRERVGKRMVQNVITAGAKQLHISHTQIDPDKIHLMTTEQYNNYAQVAEWMCYLQTKVMDIKPYFVPDMDALAPDVKYVVTNAIFVQRERTVSYIKWTYLFTTAIYLPMLPVNIALLCFERHSLQSIFSVFNIQTGKLEKAWLYGTDETYSTASRLHAFVYDCLYDLKKGDRK
ncbi:MAG: M48 family metallopeptidase [Bacteroidales bacterium]|jgi:hypothetical protein|nr:M48 family metallopeptidase [Bacteroidales bacterium]